MNAVEYAALRCRIKVRSWFERVFKEESGAAELIATLIIVGIVLVLAIAFKDKLTKLISNLWNNLVRGENPSAAATDLAPQW